MNYNIDFDISALCFCVAMLFAFYRKKCIPNFQNRIFSALILSCIVAALADIGDVIMGINSGFYLPGFHQLVLYIYFIAIDMLPVLYALYIVSLTGTLDKLFKRRQGLLFFIPAVFTCLIIFSNIFNGDLFHPVSSGVYARGPAVLWLNMIALYFMALGIGYVWVYRQIIPKPKRLALYSFALFGTIPAMIQFFFPQLYITTLGVAICIFLIFMTIQNPEEVMSDIGLLNKNALYSTSSIYFRRGDSFVVLAVKINEFSYLQRVFGSETTGKYLSDIGSRLSRFMVKKEETYYVQGGCFALLIPACNMNEELPHQVMKLFDSAIKTPRMDICFSASACIISCPENAANPDAVIDYVEYFNTNERSGNHLCCASDLKLLDAVRIQEVEQAVENALKNGGLSVHYQPIYSAKENRINSAEALVRLHDEKLGNIGPDEFIPISEKKGSIIQIGMFVFRSVCEFYAAHHLEEHGIDYIHINLSVAQCMQKDLTNQLLAVLEEYHLPAGCINLEITETVAAESPGILLDMMDKLSHAGIKFSLDDYGTGFSNMTSLIEIPFSLVKIDKQLIERLALRRTQIAVGHTISMFKELNLSIVAEGVETSEQADILRRMQCDFLQGFYYSRPVPGEELLNTIQNIMRRNIYAT